MEEKAAKFLSKNARSTRLQEFIDSLLNSERLEDACEQLRSYLEDLGTVLLSVKVQDSAPNGNFVRPYVNLPAQVAKIGAQFPQNQGCPLLREAKRRVEAFDSFTIDRSIYSDFLDRRFLSELDKTEHKHIAVVPVLVGRAIAQFNVGLYDQPFDGRMKDGVLEAINQTMPTLVQRFPEIATIFDKKHLTKLEQQVIKLLCLGMQYDDVRDEIGLSEHSINILVQNASTKLEAENRSQLIFKATRLGEI